MRESDISTYWCAEKDIQSHLIDEYNQGIQAEVELVSVDYSGQVAVTAVITTTTSDEPQEKKSRIGIQLRYILCLHIAL